MSSGQPVLRLVKADPAARATGAHPVDVHVGRRVATARVRQGHTQSDLAAALGLAFQQVQKYEKGANRISASRLWEISRFLSADVSAFFEGLPTEPVAVESVGLVEADCGPATPATVEISRQSVQLERRQQKLVLELIREMLRDRSGSVAA